jgi:hypothetical protein
MVGATMVEVYVAVVVEYCATETDASPNVKQNNTEATVKSNHRRRGVFLNLTTQHSKSTILLANISQIIPHGIV